MAIGSLNKSIHLFNFFAKEFICQKNFESEITAVKFSNDGKLLVLGFLNGNFFKLDSHMTDKNYLGNRNRLNANVPASKYNKTSNFNKKLLNKRGQK